MAGRRRRLKCLCWTFRRRSLNASKQYQRHVITFTLALHLVLFCRWCQHFVAYVKYAHKLVHNSLIHIRHKLIDVIFDAGLNQLIRIDRIEFFRYARSVAGEDTIFMRTNISAVVRQIRLAEDRSVHRFCATFLFNIFILLLVGRGRTNVQTKVLLLILLL